MLTNLRLQRFKNFKDAELKLGQFTVLVGTNASGKSNIRDAFRFLHGIGRGYTLAEIIGEKWGEGGVLQWRGIRGGTREVAFDGTDSFALEASLTIPYTEGPLPLNYGIEVHVGANGKPARVLGERLTAPSIAPYLFDMHPEKVPPPQDDQVSLKAGVWAPEHERSRVEVSVSARRPVLGQIEDSNIHIIPKSIAIMSKAMFVNMRFLDLAPDAMRLPSLPGQDVLGDRGENLSSVLLNLYQDPWRRDALIGWLQELTPMDACDFEFAADQTGRVSVTLIEEGGRKTSAYSASDGTLRFLAMIAALQGSGSETLFFFEELENGIHPTRLPLLLQLIEQATRDRGVQVVATTHSPQLLGLLSPEALEHVSLIYRLPGRRDANIKRIVEIPDARRVLQRHTAARLFESGWLENAVSFQEPTGAPA